ncbi:hypothetical protein [Streptomyces sp. NPDC051162]|uniref:hypothetical protein n=1 Tax=unclassified Streptomyces TaxID=2593676 RepID=UPI0034333828
MSRAAEGNAGGVVVPVVRLVTVTDGPDAEGWREALAPELVADHGIGAIAEAAGDGGPWALFCAGAGTGAALRAAERAARPPVHVLLWLGDRGPGEETEESFCQLPCPVTILASAAVERHRAVVPAWRGLTEAPLTVRILPAACPLPGACDRAGAQVIKEELRVWPA